MMAPKHSQTAQSLSTRDRSEREKSTNTRTLKLSLRSTLIQYLHRRALPTDPQTYRNGAIMLGHRGGGVVSTRDSVRLLQEIADVLEEDSGPDDSRNPR